MQHTGLVIGVLLAQYYTVNITVHTVIFSSESIRIQNTKFSIWSIMQLIDFVEYYLTINRYAQYRNSSQKGCIDTW